jgi:hypothetical protein
VPPSISIFRTGERIAQMQRSAGLEPTCSSWIGLLLTFAFGLETLYYQLELNRVWDRYGNPPEGPAVALALVRRPPDPGESWSACGAGTGRWLPLLRRRQVRLSRRAGPLPQRVSPGGPGCPDRLVSVGGGHAGRRVRARRGRGSRLVRCRLGVHV